jgi:phosphohistidine phosphatase
MKQLIIFRHAKTEEKSSSGADFDRNLKEKGREDAKKMGLYFPQHFGQPELILCSTANRAMQTSAIYRESSQFKGKLLELPGLYHASASELLDIVLPYTQMYNHIMLIGHNMGISQLANMLSASGCEELPTAGIAVLDFENGIEPYKGQLKAFITPKTI